MSYMNKYGFVICQNLYQDESSDGPDVKTSGLFLCLF